MPVSFTEPQFNAEHLISEANGGLSRESVGLVTSVTYKSGLVMGQISLGTATASAVTGTGNGVISGVGRKSNAKVGVYTVTCVQAVTNGGVFSVVDPDGVQLPHAYVGVAYDNQIQFSIADGATDFTVGAFFTVTVAAGSGLYTAFDPAATNGSGIPSLILLNDIEVGSGGGRAVGHVRFCEVDTSKLVWGAGVTTTPQKTAALAVLAKAGVIGRSGVSL